MIPDPKKVAIGEHQRWLGYLQPEGLVVSALALVDSQVQLDTGSYAATHERCLDALKSDPASGDPYIEDFPVFAREFLGWEDELLSVFSASGEVPDVLRVSTGEHGEILEPSAAYQYFKPDDPARKFMLLVKQIPLDDDIDAVPSSKQQGWVASPHQKFEHLLRETKVPIGVLCNGRIIRLVYAPKGENSGWLTFPVKFMSQIEGRAVASALDLLLSHRRLVVVPEAVRLPGLLRKSREYQAHVSTALSSQVLESLYELGRGFQSADEKARGKLLADVWERNPQEIYGGLITTLLRMVFLLYAEDRGLMPSGELYQQGYSVLGLFEQLRDDYERYPDTMDDRFGGWPRLLNLFRAVYAGCKHRAMHLPARRGHLFDPNRFPFLEGRPNARQPISDSLPRLSDGCLYRVLDLLLFLDGERIFYKNLDVEQIGSVYETIMGFHIEKAKGRSIALKPQKAHGAPVHINLDVLLELKKSEREKLLKEVADTVLPSAAGKALGAAKTIDDLLAALEKRIDRRATPHPVPVGSVMLQPTDERRRSGSHYTPRTFTRPIVQKALEPILERLGRHPRPEDILELKLADIAVGSGAFLVESCRQLADELVAAWHYHKCLPVIPPDEDEVLVARRLIAQRCLYGVDRNPMAVDLAKLSMWLTTMAKDHPFTYLDHAIKCGDSLVGLTNKQIAAFHWDPSKAIDQLFGEGKLEQAIKRVSDERKRILEFPEDSEAAVLKKREFLAAAEEATDSIRNAGDLVVAAYFAADKPKERQKNRDDYIAKRFELEKNAGAILTWQIETLNRLRSSVHPIIPFHWEIEFPEVFSRDNSGFDAIVGNPPFLGGKRISTVYGDRYKDYLIAAQSATNGNADLVARFFRRAFALVRKGGVIGLIATNTIAQGDTRRSGLQWICKNKGVIYACTKRYPWPGEVAVVVSTIHIIRGEYTGTRVLDGRCVDQITAFLFHAGGNDDPASLASNQGLSFIGCDIKGQGFLFADDDPEATALSEWHRLSALNDANHKIVMPYMSGEEINDSPVHSANRWVINFGTRGLEECKAWPELLAIIEAKVRPERASKSAELAGWPWWQFWRSREQLSAAVAGKKHILALSRINSWVSIALVPTGTVYSEAVVLFALDKMTYFSVLQSQVHELWARFLSSTAIELLRYAPSDCFETFPFPNSVASNLALEAAGKLYFDFRAALMVTNNEGLTKTYNRFHDPEETTQGILRLRELHCAMDTAVLTAYGWDDLIRRCNCEFLLDYEEEDEDEVGKSRNRKKPWRYRWPDDVRDEVLARLLALNAERHEEEVRLGIAPGMTKPGTPSAKKLKSNPDQMELI